MAGKATPKKQDNRANPISKKGKKEKLVKEKDPKDSHLYTDDNPETTLQGTGFKDATTANNTSEYLRICLASAPMDYLTLSAFFGPVKLAGKA